jgi:hypothetical protein
MKHSDRIRWFEAAYEHLRAELVPEAPHGVALTIGWPTKKRQGKDLCVGETAFEVFRNVCDGTFGCETLITLHPIQSDDLILQLATLVHEMIHHALPPEAKHKKEFQALATRVGLCPPWTATQPDGTLQQILRGILLDVNRDLGYEPTGHYTPKPPVPKKPGQKKKLKCKCDTPRTLVLPQSQVEKGVLICGNCHSPFVLMTDVQAGSEWDLGASRRGAGDEQTGKAPEGDLPR